MIRWVILFRLLCVASFIVVLSAGLRPEPFAQMFKYADKFLHFSAFAGLTLFFLLARPGRWRWIGLVAIAFFGLGLEYGQGLWLEKRTTSLWDALANLAGILMALGLFEFVRQRSAVKDRSEKSEDRGEL